MSADQHAICVEALTSSLPIDSRRQAKFLYWMGWRVCDIAEATGTPEKTIHSWKARDEWDRADSVERIGGALEARLVMLVMKPEKTGGDYKEIDLLYRQLEREYDYLTSDEVVDGAIVANRYTFTEAGRRFG